MSSRTDTSQRDAPAESLTAWFVVLERARRTDNYELADRARCELACLGVTVKFGRPQRRRERGRR